MNKNNSLANKRVGEENINNKGYHMVITEYLTANNILVTFDDGTQKRSRYDLFKRGMVDHPKHTKALLNKEKYEGVTNINTQGLKMTIVKYNKTNDIIIRFEDGYERKGDLRSFKEGCIKNPNYKQSTNKVYKKNRENHIGETSVNNQGCLMKIVEYINYQNVVIEFQDEYHFRVKTTCQQFRNGKVWNPYSKGPHGEIIGDKYPTKINYVQQKEYIAWCGILGRVFGQSETFRKGHQSYNDVTIANEWLYYPNFYEWLHDQPNFNKWINSSKFQIDKDIMCQEGEKIYSPQTCFIVPAYINYLLIHNAKEKGNNLPYGIGKNKKGKQYYHYIKNENGEKYKVSFYSLEEAVESYKNYKNNKILKAAEYAYSKGDISLECYKALLKYDFFKNIV